MSVPKVLGKRKMEDDDGIVVEKAMELPCNMFNKLRQDNWFNAWLFDSWHGDVG
jgi:hypothetical protein